MKTYSDEETARFIYSLVNGETSMEQFKALPNTTYAGWMALAVYGKMRGLEYFKSGMARAEEIISKNWNGLRPNYCALIAIERESLTELP